MEDRPKARSLGDRVRLKINGLMAHSLSRRPLRSELSSGIVTFTFDDFPASAYRIGGAILERHGVRGTYYAAFGLLGGESEGQRMMNGDDVVDLLHRGHELGCHTYSHVSCRRLGRLELEAELDRNASALARVARRVKFDSFSYPFGDIDLSAKRLVGHRFVACRGRRAGLNFGTIDLAALDSESLYSRSDPIERTLAAIDRAAEKRGWLIFCTHDVTDDPSPYGCTPAHLEAAVRAAVESRCEVLTIVGAYERLAKPHFDNLGAG